MPEATHCALASTPGAGLSRTSRVGDTGLGAVKDSPRFQNSPNPGRPPPSSANLDPRSRRKEAPGGGGGSQRRSRVRSQGSRFLPAPALSGLGFASGQMGTNFPAPPSDAARHHSDPRGAGTSRDAREGRGGKGGGGEGEVEVRGTHRGR